MEEPVSNYEPWRLLLNGVSDLYNSSELYLKKFSQFKSQDNFAKYQSYKRMQNLSDDLLFQLSVKLDNASLARLSLTPLWSKVEVFARTQYFWYLRTQHYVSLQRGDKNYKLEFNKYEDWKEAYYLLSKSLQFYLPQGSVFSEESLSSALVVGLLLDLGYVPREQDLQMAVARGYADTVRVLLADGRTDPALENNLAIREAAEQGYTEVVRALLLDERVNPAAVGNHALALAAEGGHTGVVKLLLADKRVDPTSRYHEAIRSSSERGHAGVVKLLLDDGRTDPAVENNYPIRYASEDGHAEVVKLLLQDQRVDPTADDNYAIKQARANGHEDVVELLLADGRIDPAVLLE